MRGIHSEHRNQDIGFKKYGEFENDQTRKVHDDSGNKPAFAGSKGGLFPNKQPQKIIEQYVRDKDCNVRNASPGIKHKAGQKQKGLPQLRKDKQEKQECKRQKEVEKNERGKKHICGLGLQI